MNLKYSLYNNELLTGISILSVLSYSRKLELTKCLLIEPLLNHKETRLALNNSNIIIRSIEELIMKKQVSFANFNKRFIESLPLSINAILLMNQLGLININGKQLSLVECNFDFGEKSLGKTAKERIKACKKISEILGKDTATYLYLNLRIEL